MITRVIRLRWPAVREPLAPNTVPVAALDDHATP